MATELATAYVSIIPSTRGLGRKLMRELNAEIPKAGDTSGKGMGAAFMGGAAKALKVGGLGAAVVGAFTVKKGLDRALNIENAEAKLKGLGHSADSVKRIMGSANAAVLDTAYTLDEAGTVAASAVAAGIKPGKDLTKYLKMTADAATIGGTSLAEMGAIINKTTARGKVYTENLNQLAERGIPIFQWLADEYGVTQEALAGMVRRGEVDSATFQKVIQKNIGGAALESGKTTTGAFNNMLAAIGRVGANLVTQVLPLIAGGFRGITAVLKGLEPLAAALGGAIAKAIGGFTRWIRESDAVKTAIQGVKDFVGALWGSFRDLFNGLRGGSGGFSVLGGALKVVKGAIEGVLTVGGTLLSWLAKNADLVRNLALAYGGFKLAQFSRNLIGSAKAWAVDTWAKIQNAKASVASKIETMRLWGMYAADKIRLLVTSTAMWVKDTAAKVKNAAVSTVLAIKSKAVAAGQWLMTAAQTALNAVMNANPIGLLILGLVALGAAIAIAWRKSDAFRAVVLKVWSAVKTAAGIAWGFLKSVFTAIWNWIKTRLIPVFQVYARVARAVWNAVGAAVRWAWVNLIKPAFDRLRNGLAAVRRAFAVAKDLVGRVWSAMGRGVSVIWHNVIRPAFDRLRGGLSAVRRAFSAARDFIGRTWSRITDAIKNPIKAAMGIINRFLIRPINSIAGALNINGGKLIGEINTKGWAEGGYTGRMNRRRVAGVVHGDEHVIRSRSRRALERDRPGALDWMNQTGMWPGYARGGRVMPLKGATFSTYPGHTGVDLNAPNDMGKPVLAAAAGVVSAVRHLKKSYGSHVWVRMANGLSAIYAHLSKITVKRGQRVVAGQQVGNVGSTGNSTGPHLHFEIRPHGTYAASKAFLQGAKNLAGGVSADGEDGSGFISKILNARKTLKKKLKGIGGPIGDIVRGAAGKVANGAVDWVKSRVDKVFGWVKKGWNAVFGDNGDKPATSRSVQAAKGAAFNALKGMGWGFGQWSPLERLWMKESGWRWNARNPSSGAYGIPQALPARKMASAGKDWRTNPLTQIKWGLRYIKQRYGSPGKAWAHSQRTGWYDEGGWLEPYGRGGRGRGANVGVNKTRKPEPVLTAAQWALLKRFLPLKRSRQSVTDLRTVERIVARVTRKYGDTSKQAARARRVALDAKFNLTGKQWTQLRKMLPGYTKRAGRPDSLRDMQRVLTRVGRRYGRGSKEYRQTRRMTYQARFGGQYTASTWQQIKKLLPQTGQYATASRAANQIRSLVLKTFGAQSPIYRRTAKLAAKINTATQKIASFNTSIANAQKAQTELAQNLTEKFRPDAFGNGLESLRLTLAANVNDARAFGAALKTATSKGLSGGLLKALAASGDVQTAKEIANLSRAQIQALENQWAQREKVTAQIGAQAASLAYGPDIRALRASIAQQNRVLRSLRADLRDATYRGTKAGISGTTRKSKAKKKTKGRK